jgi:hypothetical protein
MVARKRKGDTRRAAVSNPAVAAARAIAAAGYLDYYVGFCILLH